MHPRDEPRSTVTGRASASPPGYDTPESPYAAAGYGGPPYIGRDRVLRTPEMMGYKPLEGLGTLLVGLCGLWTLSSFYRVYAAFGYRNMIHRHGVDLAKQPVVERDQLREVFELTSGLRAVFLFLVGFLLILWVVRSYSNLRAVSAPAGLAPTWKVVAVLVVPILNLVMMRRFLDDLWVRSESYVDPQPLSPKIVDFTWGACIAGLVSGALFDFGPVKVLEGDKFSSDLALLAAVAFTVMVVAVALFVYKVTQRLTLRSAEMTETVLHSAR